LLFVGLFRLCTTQSPDINTCADRLDRLETSRLTSARMKVKMEKIMQEGSKTDTARYCIGLITGRGIVRDKSTIIIKVGEKEVVQLNKLFGWLDIDTSIFTIGEEFIVVVKSSSFIKYLHNLLQKEGSTTIIWGKKIREWGEWPESRVNEDSQFVRGYMEGVHALKGNNNPKSKDFELQTM